MKVGIVGNGTDKFTEKGKERAKELIRELLVDADLMVSGHSPVGGVDIWAEEVADELGVEKDLKIPQTHKWDGRYGYKARNLDIANDSDIVHIIVARSYPDGYSGMRFKMCYHCKSDNHVKSGGCWTGKKAANAKWHFIDN